MIGGADQTDSTLYAKMRHRPSSWTHPRVSEGRFTCHRSDAERRQVVRSETLGAVVGRRELAVDSVSSTVPRTPCEACRLLVIAFFNLARDCRQLGGCRGQMLSTTFDPLCVLARYVAFNVETVFWRSSKPVQDHITRAI